MGTKDGSDEYRGKCLEECKKNCTMDGSHKCFGKVHHSKSNKSLFSQHVIVNNFQIRNISTNQKFCTAPIKSVSSTTAEVPCQCGQSTVKRYTGRYCGPKRQPCNRKERGADANDTLATLENVWVDGNNTFHHKKSNIPMP